MGSPVVMESPTGLTQEPLPVETGYIPSQPQRKLTSDTFSGLADSRSHFIPSPGPSRRPTVDATGAPDGGVPSFQPDRDGLGSGANIMNSSAGFSIEKATIIGGNNVQGQSTPAIFNIYGSGGSEPERSRSPGWDGLYELATLRQQAFSLSHKEQELKERETQVAAREVKVRETERVVEENEKTVRLLIQSLKKLEGELQQRRSAESQRVGGDGAKAIARLGGHKYVTPRLRGAFKHLAVGIEDLAYQFDFTTIDPADRAEEPAFYVPLAPHYGGLDREQVGSFPESLKIAIWSVVTRIEAARSEAPFTFEDIGELLTLNSHLESSGFTQHVREGPIWLKENFKSSDLAVFHEWFDTLLTDRDLQRANQTLAKIKKKGGSQELPTSAYDTKPLVDALVLWFPVDVRRSFRISRTTVKLCTTPRQGRFGLGQQKRYFVMTEHQTSCIFHPRESFIYGVAKEKRESIVREMESLIEE